VVQANLLTAAFTSVTGVIQRGIGAFQANLGENMQLQLSNMTTASSLAAMTGQSFEDAGLMVDRLNGRLAASAANLPGVTSDYQMIARGITDNLIPAVKDAAGAVDTQRLENELVKISEAYGVLGAGAGLAGQQVVFGLSRALGGASLAELKQFEFFQELPQVMNFLEESLKATGQDLKSLDPAARLKLLQDAAQKFVTDEFKSRAGESVDGLIQGFKSGLFDPVSGVFGMSRDLELEVSGVQSVFTSFNDFLKALVGSDGLYGGVSKLLNSLGLTVDPMKILQVGFNKATAAIKVVSGFVKNLQAVAEAGGDAGDILRLIPIYVGGFKNRVTQGLDRIAAAPIGEMLGNLFNGMTANAGALLSKVDGGAIGAAIGRFAGIAFNHLTTLISTIDFGALIGLVGIGFGKLLSGLVSGLVSAIITLDTRSLIVLALGAIGAAIVPALVSAALGLVSAVGGFLITSAGSAVLAAMMPPLVSAFVTVAGGIAAGLVGLPLIAIAPLALAVVAVFALLGKTVYEHRDRLWTEVQNFFRPIGEFFNAANAFFAADGREEVLAAARRMRDALFSLFDSVRNIFRVATGGQTVSADRAQESATLAGDRLSAALSTQTVAGWTAPATVPNRANGQIPNAAGGLMAAAAREARAMPAGAEVVIANSSETIIPARNLRSASAGGSTTLNLGGIHIHGISDPAAIADTVVREIQARFDAARQARLA
jgi:hypothetical protein